MSTTTSYPVITSTPTQGDKLPAGYILVTADARLKGDNAKKYTPEQFESVRYRRIAIPGFHEKLAESGVPSSYLPILNNALETLAGERFSELMEASGRQATAVPSELFTVQELLTYFAESRAPRTLTPEDVFQWAKTSSFAERHFAKFNDAARMLAYCGNFKQFATGQNISLSLQELRKLSDLFTDGDMTQIGTQVKARIDSSIKRLSTKAVELDDIG